VISLVLVKALSNPPPAQTDPARGAARPATVVASVASVPPRMLGAVGSGTTFGHTLTPATRAPLTSRGKPEVLYVGADYCPYCATERWPLAVALSRFGTFTGLRGIHSSATDVYPSQPTLTFAHASYTSKYLTFTSAETTTEDPHTVLQRPTAAEEALLNRYDAPPYVQPESPGAIPFIDIGNRYLIHGAQYNPQVLQHHTWAQSAAALNDPASPIARGADGAANMITAAICKITGNQPARVCASPVITQLEGQM
jgi:hypothetical protein